MTGRHIFIAILACSTFAGLIIADPIGNAAGRAIAELEAKQ